MSFVLRSRSCLFLIVVCLGVANKVAAQDDADVRNNSYHTSFQIWSGVKINKDFKYGLSMNGQYLLRADVTNRYIKGHYLSLGLRYKILKYLYADFRFRGVNGFTENTYRFEFGLKARYKHKDWTFAYRLGYFHENEYYARSYESGHEPVDYLRNRIEINWDFKPQWEAYLSAEAYTLLTNRYALTRKFVCIAGISYEFIKNHSFDLYYRSQPDVNQRRLDMLHAFALVYTWDIPGKFKKKKK